MGPLPCGVRVATYLRDVGRTRVLPEALGAVAGRRQHGLGTLDTHLVAG